MRAPVRRRASSAGACSSATVVISARTPPGTVTVWIVGAVERPPRRPRSPCRRARRQDPRRRCRRSDRPPVSRKPRAGAVRGHGLEAGSARPRPRGRRRALDAVGDARAVGRERRRLEIARIARQRARRARPAAGTAKRPLPSHVVAHATSTWRPSGANCTWAAPVVVERHPALRPGVLTARVA